MDCKTKAEEFFEIIAQKRKTLVEIPLNCSQGETGTLLYLTFVKNGISASELADNMHVSMPRITSVLNALEAKKWVKKSIDSEDKRKNIIEITNQGREMVLSKKQEAVAKMAKVIEKLDEEEINQYIRLFRKIGNIMEELEENNATN